MVKDSAEIIQAFPLTMGTNVFSSGTTGFEIKSAVIIHMNEDGDITLHSGGNTVVVNAMAGSDWAVSDGVSSIDVSSSCIIS